jgi:hypothetical protein
MTTKVIHSGNRFGILEKRGGLGVDEIHAGVRWRAVGLQEHSSRWRGDALLYMGSD